MIEIRTVYYFSLKRKEDDVEVYTSRYYITVDDNKAIDYSKVFEQFNYYFERVNSGIQQQIESPKTSEDIKNTLKLLNIDDFKFSLMKLENEGGWKKTCLWTKNLNDFTEFKKEN